MVGTVEDALKRREIPDPESLSQIDREIIGETCRLEIPFRDVVKMRQAAELLRGYADLLDFYSRRGDLPARTILFHLRSEASALSKKLRDVRGRGRPRKGHEDA